jgi:hypothetical protein
MPNPNPAARRFERSRNDLERTLESIWTALFHLLADTGLLAWPA